MGSTMGRREWLAAAFAIGAGAARAGGTGECVRSIGRSVLFHGREGAVTWFHPRACAVPGGESPLAVMTCQNISGSDVYGQVHCTVSRDLGKTWTAPEPIGAFARRPFGDGLEMGVCDVVPEYHPHTNTVLAIGHNVYYRDNVLARPSEQRYPVYSVRRADGSWSGGRKLEWNDPRASAMHTCGCAQRYTSPDGELIIPVSFGPLGRRDRAVTTLRCSFDGELVEVREHGNELRLEVDRGLLEPSIVRFGDWFYLTIRAEDGHGYLTRSRDGLRWEAIRPWSWEDGEPLTLSTTQQHWLPGPDCLYLVYTRKAEANVNVFRWRSPLYCARFEPAKMALIRVTERVVFPLIGDGIGGADHVARMGNFHTNPVTGGESWVTVGETLPNGGWRGDTLLARVRWA